MADRPPLLSDLPELKAWIEAALAESYRRGREDGSAALRAQHQKLVDAVKAIETAASHPLPIEIRLIDVLKAVNRAMDVACGVNRSSDA